MTQAHSRAWQNMFFCFVISSVTVTGSVCVQHVRVVPVPGRTIDPCTIRTRKTGSGVEQRGESSGVDMGYSSLGTILGIRHWSSETCVLCYQNIMSTTIIVRKTAECTVTCVRKLQAHGFNKVQYPLLTLRPVVTDRSQLQLIEWIGSRFIRGR